LACFDLNAFNPLSVLNDHSHGAVLLALVIGRWDCVAALMPGSGWLVKPQVE